VVFPGTDRPGGILACESLDPYLRESSSEFGGFLATCSIAPGTLRPPPGPPAIGAIDIELLLPGDAAVVDGTSGTALLTGVTKVPVVTAFLQREDGRILLLHRSGRVGSFRGRWAGVSGFLEGLPPERQALTEIHEETGIPPARLTLAESAEPILARDGERLYEVHPFRFLVQDPEVRLDWEHTEAEWVEPSELPRRATVPRLQRAWEAVSLRATPPPRSATAPGKR
jgi:hypothetical protein